MGLTVSSAQRADDARQGWSGIIKTSVVPQWVTDEDDLPTNDANTLWQLYKIKPDTLEIHGGASNPARYVNDQFNIFPKLFILEALQGLIYYHRKYHKLQDTIVIHEGWCTTYCTTVTVC